MTQFKLSSNFPKETLTGLGFSEKQLSNSILDDTEIASKNLDIEALKLIALIDEINSGISDEQFTKASQSQVFTFSNNEVTKLAGLIQAKDSQISNLLFLNSGVDGKLARFILFNKLNQKGLIDSEFGLNAKILNIDYQNFYKSGYNTEDLKGALFNNLSSSDLKDVSATQRHVGIDLGQNSKTGLNTYRVKGTFTSISPDGHFATASHVLQNFVDEEQNLILPISITGSEKDEFFTFNPEDVEILYNNQESDLAIIHIKNYPLETHSKDYIKIGDKNWQDGVIHFGYPQDLDPFFSISSIVEWNEAGSLSEVTDTSLGSNPTNANQVSYTYFDSLTYVSAGMSGGGVFTQIDGQWSLLGINLYINDNLRDFTTTCISLNPEDTSDMELRNILLDIMSTY